MPVPMPMTARSPALLVGLGAAVGGVVSGLILLVFVAGTDGLPAAPPAGTERELASLAERVERLADENVVLLGRLRDLELARLADGRAPGEPVPLGAGPQAVLELQGQVAELAAVVEQRAGAASPADLVDGVAAALAAVRASEEREREERQAERRAERVARRLESLTSKLELDAFQQSEMARLLTEQQAARDALDELRGSADRDERRLARDALREQAERSAAGFLTSVQLEQLRDAGGFEGRRDDRGRDDRGRRRGGN